MSNSKKKKIGNLYGKPIVVGDTNLVTSNEILYTENQGRAELIKRNSNGELGEKMFGNIYRIVSNLYKKDLGGIAGNYTNIQDVIKYGLSASLYIDPDHGIYNKLDYWMPPFGGLVNDPTIYMSDKWNTVIKSYGYNNNEWVPQNFALPALQEYVNFCIDTYGYYKRTFSFNLNLIITPVLRLQFYDLFSFDENYNLVDIYKYDQKQNILQEGGKFDLQYWSDSTYSKKSPERDYFYSVSTNNPSFTVPEGTYREDLIVSCPNIFITPYIDGLLLLAAPKGFPYKSPTVGVFKTCDLSMKHWRESIGMPESMVIPVKSGKFIPLDL